MHIMVYSKEPKEGYLTKKGIEDMRSIFANDIFRNEQYHLFELQTQLRDELKEEFDSRLAELVYRSEMNDICSLNIADLFTELISQLHSYTGRKQYGYFPKPMKDTVDKIVNELARDDRIADFYNEWNSINREKLSLYYDTPKPDIPLAENKEFRSIKNAVIKAAVSMMNEPRQFKEAVISTSKQVNGLLSLLGNLLSLSCQKRRERLRKQIDSKLRAQINEKKAALGQKSDGTNYWDDEDEGYGEMTM